jgi:APA family basic amino acid/polyamine antiporter
VGYIGGEVKNMNRNIPKGITIGMFIIIAMYLLANTAYLSLLPVQTLENIHQSGTGIAAIEAVKTFWGRSGNFLLLC